MAKKKKNILGWVISEAAFFFTLFYLLFALGAGVNLWLGSLILFALANVSIMACPVLRSCCK